MNDRNPKADARRLGSLDSVDGRPALRFERHLPHSVERVWRAVTAPAELERWFAGPVAWTPSLGEVLDGEGEVTELREPEVIAWSVGADRFRFELQALGDGCLLVFVHVVDDRSLSAQTAAGWDTYLDRLDAHLAGGHLTEERAHAPIAELHERYAARFGMDPAPGRKHIAGLDFRGLTLDDGPVLRLERRYEHPVERVWRAITDASELRHWFPSDEPITVQDSDQPRLLVGTWYGDELRFRLHAEGAGCVLLFTHAFTDADTAARTAAGWDRCFARLDALFAGVPLSEEDSLALWPGVHERYAEAFGVDPEVGRAAYAEHPLT